MLNINAYIDNENAFLVKFIICGRLCTIFPNLVKCCSMHCDSNCAAHHFTNEMNFLLIRYRLSSCVIYRLVATVILISLCKGRKYYKKGRAIELEVVSFTLVQFTCFNSFPVYTIVKFLAMKCFIQWKPHSKRTFSCRGWLRFIIEEKQERAAKCLCVQEEKKLGYWATVIDIQ